MNKAEIIEIFVKAAEVDRKLPNTARPAGVKAMNHGYVHDTADMNGWSSEDKHAANWAWLDPAKVRNTTNDMGIWQASMELMKLVPNELQRRALWAWARSEAGGQAFAKWCRQVEGISRQLGDWRKTAAIEGILREFDRKPAQHNGNVIDAAFTNHPEIEDKRFNIEVWRPEESKPVCGFDDGLRDFSWAEAQNERRRQRELRRRKSVIR
ncbi:hypothetical protein GOZ89_09645 [Agrobacterium vitis]|uniref:hypothetical protein n=1 Tax=Agrobacterium vitis TaxID=373 RepID=UPI0008732CE9|nr:hypothetical protein [Agrobacterium vitis]MCE6073657.1 hypothetical protein [Agrobacterium vitis]MCM2452231.1 hypothetical protein [Agrobacterium vitis]MCM2469590.1 hypothetical protein [Agrobacterium vitis]MUO68939.1 hypothetical protein [Agrobacterium vitis]MUO84734.1 hypothetical protein [Agrobacterium vitis]